MEKVSHFKCALGDKEETITMTGGTHKIVLGRTYNIECFKLDDFEFEDIDFMLGGETGIDIYPTGKDKRQVLNFINNDWPCVFFGDKTLPGGNDYPLAISVDVAHRVENWEHTWEILKLTS